MNTDLFQSAVEIHEFKITRKDPISIIYDLMIDRRNLRALHAEIRVRILAKVWKFEGFLATILVPLKTARIIHISFHYIKEFKER